MKKFLLGIITGVVLASLTVVVIAFSLIRLGDRRPVVPEGATLVLQLSGDLPEKAPVSLPIPFLGSPTPVTVFEVWHHLRRASSDNRVKGVVLDIGQVDAGWAKLQELREDVLAFRKSGKPVYALLKSPRMREYYLATAADRIYSAPEDLIDVKGMRAELMYLRNTFDKLGIEFQVSHVGRYKDAGDMFTQTGPSPETLESMNALLDGLYGQVLQSIAASRKRSVAEIRQLIDNGPYTARQAHAKGLIDELRFEDQIFGEIKGRLKQSELKKVSFRDYVKSASPERGKNRVALVVGEGTILRGRGADALGSDDGFSSGAFVRMLRKVSADDSIKGVILRVDSPGGDAFASDEILREVKLLRDKKPTVISMSDTAASGGYYVSMTGDPVLAYPNTLTGSIGVLYTRVNLKGLYDKVGIRKEILTRGDNAAIDSDYGPLSPEAREKIQTGLQEFYTQFVSKVAQSRKRKYEDVEPLAQGRVWLGQHAKERGLIDDLGGLDAAVAAWRKKANVKEGEVIGIVPYPPRRSLLDQWLQSTTESVSIENRVSKLLGINPTALTDGGYMRLMPFSVNVR